MTLRKCHHVTLTKFRNHISTNISHVHFTHERIAILRHGKLVAAVVSGEDLHLLEEFERKTLEQKRRETAALMERWERVKSGDYSGD